MRNNHGRKERAPFQFCLPTTEPEFPEKKRPSEGSRRMALSGPKMLARPEYVPLWNNELNVWRSGFAGFLSPLAKSVANPMRGRQRTDEKEYQSSAATRHALIVPTPKLPN